VETIDGEGGGWGRPGDDKRLRETETNGGVGRRGRGCLWLKTVADRWGPHEKKKLKRKISWK
jgi:hypothetical protein